MLSALKQIFAPPLVKQQAHQTYVAVVTQARQPVFYRDWQVEDRVDGRFDVIILHLFLILSRCEDDHRPEVQAFTRYLSEAFFADMDRSLREMGASDTGVGIRVKKMAQAFYGRMKAYQSAIGDEAALMEALKRNVYRDKPVSSEALASLAQYMQSNHHLLKEQTLAAIMQGDMQFGGA